MKIRKFLFAIPFFFSTLESVIHIQIEQKTVLYGVWVAFLYVIAFKLSSMPKVIQSALILIISSFITSDLQIRRNFFFGVLTGALGFLVYYTRQSQQESTKNSIKYLRKKISELQSFKSLIQNFTPLPLIVISKEKEKLFTNTEFLQEFQQSFLSSFSNLKIISETDFLPLNQEDVDLKTKETLERKLNFLLDSISDMKIDSIYTIFTTREKDMTLGYEIFIRKVYFGPQKIISLLLIFKKINTLNSSNDIHALTDGFTTSISMIAHDLQTPVNKIKILVSDISTANIEAIKRICNYQSNVIGSLLLYAKLKKGILTKKGIPEKDISIKGVFYDVYEIFKDEINLKCLQMYIYLKDTELNQLSDIETRIEKDCLMRVLVNLVSNALKFTSYGSITLECKLIGGDEVEFSVEDTGPGIPENILPKLFHEFATFSISNVTNSHGTGLGLMICKELVRFMGGSKINVESIVSKGTKFSFCVPIDISQTNSVKASPCIEQNLLLKEENAQQLVLQPSGMFTKCGASTMLRHCSSTINTQKYNLKLSTMLSNTTQFDISALQSLVDLHKITTKDFQTQKIMVIDDDAFNMQAIKVMLIKFGLESPMVFFDGIYALNYLEKQHTDFPDIIIIDYFLPGKSGIEITKAIRDILIEFKHPFFHIILVSAADKSTGFSGIDAFLKKPLKIYDLLEAIVNAVIHIKQMKAEHKNHKKKTMLKQKEYETLQIEFPLQKISKF